MAAEGDSPLITRENHVLARFYGFPGWDCSLPVDSSGAICVWVLPSRGGSTGLCKGGYCNFAQDWAQVYLMKHKNNKMIIMLGMLTGIWVLVLVDRKMSW